MAPTALRLGKVAFDHQTFLIKTNQAQEYSEKTCRVNRAGRITAPCSIRGVCDWWRPLPDVDTYRRGLNSQEFDRLVYYSPLPSPGINLCPSSRLMRTNPPQRGTCTIGLGRILFEVRGGSRLGLFHYLDGVRQSRLTQTSQQFIPHSKPETRNHQLRNGMPE